MCTIKISAEDAQFAQKALCMPDLVDPKTDLIMGKSDIWDGSRVEVRLCGVPEQPAFMAIAVFRGEELSGFIRTETYHTSFDFRIDQFEYLVTLHEDKTLDKKTPETSAKKGKTPPTPNVMKWNDNVYWGAPQYIFDY